MQLIPRHVGEPPAPHDLWSSWSPDLWTAASLTVVGAVYTAGMVRRRVHPVDMRPDALFAGGLGVVLLALLTPLDAAAAATASAHMVQHLLLVLAAAPLLAASEPGATLMLGTPRWLRRATGRWRHRFHLGRSTTTHVRRPLPAFLAYTGTLWFWHAAVPYQSALEDELVHAIMHTSFLLSGLLLWAVLFDAARSPAKAPAGILLSFAAAFQGALLSALLVFADAAWYPGYATSTVRWGLTAVADQQLAGALMWTPAGFIHLATALALLLRWVSSSDKRPVTTGRKALPHPPSTP